MMKKTWSLLLATAMVAGMLTGCGGQKSNGGSEAAATEPVAVEEPTTDENTSYKKEIRIGTLADLTVKNRYAGTATVTTQTCNSTFNGLVSMGTDGEAAPELATEWSSNDDSSEWTFKLREGVKFHDGSDFTADDVKFTWEYASSTENDGITQPITGASMVDEVVVDDP